MSALKPPPNLAELEQENLRLRGDLLTVASRISHDLRTPLGSISTTCEILKEVIAENNPDHADLLSPIFESTDEAARLIERVSFVLRASVAPGHKRPMPMGAAVSAALQRLENRLLAKKATINQASDWPEVLGVPRWLETIWWNFLANVLQHGCAAPKIELGWRDGGEELRFWIEDNGDGVPAEAQLQLFQPFQTLHEISSTRGLGLSIVQRLVELQGGTCGYEHTPRKRVCFFFTLPAH